LLLATCEDI